VKGRLKRWVRGAAGPIGGFLAALGVTADGVTVAGVLAAMVSAYGFLEGSRTLAFGGLLASALCDLFDGAVARAGGRSGTRFGAALDSSLDRYGEGLVFGAILAYLATAGLGLILIALALLAGVGSFMVSYVRARSEGLGIPCEVGILERPERLLLLLVLSLWGDGGMIWILGAIALLSHVTFVHRLVHVRRKAAYPGQPDMERAR